MSAGLAYSPAQLSQPDFSKRNVDIISEPPVGGIATRALATVTKTNRGPQTHNGVLKDNCGWPIDPVAWAKRTTASKMLAEQNERIAQALQDAGEDVILKGGLTTISAITNITETQIRYRAVRFLPVVAARDRRPMVNGLKLFMIEHRNAHYFRYGVMTCDELIPAFGELRKAIQTLSRKISKWSNGICKKNGIKALYRGIEFTRATAAERDADAEKHGRKSDLSARYGPKTVLYHLHANVLYWPTRIIEDWTDFLRKTYKFIGAEWRDCGKVEKIEEIVKYCSKPADTAKASGDELLWLFKHTKLLKICQSLGDFKDWMQDLEDRREKVVWVRRENGDSKLMRVKKGKRGGPIEDEDNQNEEFGTGENDVESVDTVAEPNSDNQETRAQDANGEAATNIVIGLTLPQWRHTPWAEPAILIQNYNPSTLSEEDGYYIREWQREAREWWDAACAPAPETALEVARVALEAVSSGAKMSSNDIRKAAGAADYIVHTCRPTVRESDSELDSIPYIQPDEAIFEETKPPRPSSIKDIMEGADARERLKMISDKADQRRSIAEKRLRGLPTRQEAAARQTLERDFPAGKSVVVALMADANGSSLDDDPNLIALLSAIRELSEMQMAA